MEPVLALPLAGPASWFEREWKGYRDCRLEQRPGSLDSRGRCASAYCGLKPVFRCSVKEGSVFGRLGVDFQSIRQNTACNDAWNDGKFIARSAEFIRRTQRSSMEHVTGGGTEEQTRRRHEHAALLSSGAAIGLGSASLGVRPLIGLGP